MTTSGEYSDYCITNVFRNKEDAEAYAGTHGESYETGVEEYELREGPVERRAWHSLYWHPHRADEGPQPGRMGNPWEYAETRDFDGDPRRVEHNWSSSRGITQDDQIIGIRLLRVQGWDRARVLKVYSEQRAQELARREGIA